MLAVSGADEFIANVSNGATTNVSSVKAKGSLLYMLAVSGAEEFIANVSNGGTTNVSGAKGKVLHGICQRRPR